MGGPNNDSLTGSGGADTLTGGDGIDTASYADHGSVTVTIDNAADDGDATDGPAGARDDVDTTVENLTGGAGNDTLTGSPLANRITGGLGSDRLLGLGGNDTLIANDGVIDTQIDCDGATPVGAADHATIDTTDPTPANCETITRSSAPQLRRAGQLPPRQPSERRPRVHERPAQQHSEERERDFVGAAGSEGLAASPSENAAPTRP